MEDRGENFKTEFLGQEIPKDPRLSELKDWCKVFHDHNLLPPYKGSSCGNLSFRLKEGEVLFFITCSQIETKDKLCADCFALVTSCDLKKGIVRVYGKREPSSESMLHFGIYNKRKDINAIFHGHSEKILLTAGELGITETKKEARDKTKEE